MPEDALLLTVSDHIATLTLNRPERLNSLDETIMTALPGVLDEIEANSDVRVVIITGSGDRAFSTGFDLSNPSGERRWEEMRSLLERNYRIFLRLWRLRQPTISAVNGYAVAAGSNIAMMCDISIASEKAQFGEPELRHYALSPMLILPWIATNKKYLHYLYYSGDIIDAWEAERLGMVAKVVPHDKLMAEANRMAERIARVPPESVQSTKQSLLRTYEIMGIVSALDYHRITDTTVITADIPEKNELLEIRASQGMRAFLEARDGWFYQHEADSPPVAPPARPDAGR